MTRSARWLLDADHRPIPCDDIAEWARMFENTATRKVALTDISGVSVSTVFLGIDHQFGEGPPLLFETMIFGGPLDQEQWRYSSWDDAVVGHKMAVKKVKAYFRGKWEPDTPCSLPVHIRRLVERQGKPK